MADEQELYAAYKTILDHLRSNASHDADRANFDGSEARCVKALLETCKSDAYIREELQHILTSKTQFPVEQSDAPGGMVTQGPISVTHYCPHHLYAVKGTAYVSYIPKGNHRLGLSKLTRVAQSLAQRPVLQEQLAADIADCLHKGKHSRFPSIESHGSAVQLVEAHGCMYCRGVRENALTSVVELRGAFWESGFENKFYSAVHSIKTSGL